MSEARINSNGDNRPNTGRSGPAFSGDSPVPPQVPVDSRAGADSASTVPRVDNAASERPDVTVTPTGARVGSADSPFTRIDHRPIRSSGAAWPDTQPRGSDNTRSERPNVTVTPTGARVGSADSPESLQDLLANPAPRPPGAYWQDRPRTDSPSPNTVVHSIPTPGPREPRNIPGLLDQPPTLTRRLYESALDGAIRATNPLARVAERQLSHYEGTKRKIDEAIHRNPLDISKIRGPWYTIKRGYFASPIGSEDAFYRRRAGVIDINEGLRDALDRSRGEPSEKEKTIFDGRDDGVIIRRAIEGEGTNARVNTTVQNVGEYRRGFMYRLSETAAALAAQQLYDYEIPDKFNPTKWVDPQPEDISNVNRGLYHSVFSKPSAEIRFYNWRLGIIERHLAKYGELMDFEHHPLPETQNSAAVTVNTGEVYSPEPDQPPRGTRLNGVLIN